MLRNLCQGLTGAILYLALVAPVSAATVTISWNPNPEPDVTNYNVYVRTQFSGRATYRSRKSDELDLPQSSGQRSALLCR